MKYFVLHLLLNTSYIQICQHNHLDFSVSILNVNNMLLFDLFQNIYGVLYFYGLNEQGLASLQYVEVFISSLFLFLSF